MSQPRGNVWQPHPVLHPPVEAPPNNRDIVWIDEMPQSTWVDRGVISSVSVLALGSAFLIMAPMVALPAVGAARSTRLRWAARQSELQAALAEQQAYVQGQAESGAHPAPTDVEPTP